MKSYCPPVSRLAKSGWANFAPVSITATVRLGSPVVIFHAWVREMKGKDH